MNGIDADLAGELREGRALEQVAGFQMLAERDRGRLGEPKAVFAEGSVIGDKERTDLRALISAAPLHGLAEVVIGVGFVDEAAT